MTDLNSKVAFITGAAHGQGRASAIALAKEKVHIAAVDIARPLSYPGYKTGSSSDLETLKQECESYGVRCLNFEADVRDAKAIGQAVDQSVKELGSISFLFNNAGICAYGLSHQLTEEQWDTMIDINLKGPWLVGKAVIPHMIQQKFGVILNNSSVCGLKGMANLSHYTASKWGLTGLTKSWAVELAQYGIRVLSIHPTGVNTPLNDGLAELEGLTPTEVAERSAGNLLPVPWVEASDVAHAVVFLFSDKARYLTGSEFVIDAGLLTK